MYQSPTPVPVNVIWKVFIDVIKMRSYRIRMGPESLGKREIWTDTHTHAHRGKGHMETEQGLERCSYKARNTKYACNSGSWKRQGKFFP